MNKKNKKANSGKLFGITEKQVNIIYKKIQHARVDSDTMSELAKLMGITNSKELGFTCYTFGRIVERNESSGNLWISMDDLLAKFGLSK